MTRLEDRQTLLFAIDAARAGGARLAQACALVRIDPRTAQRWRKHDGLARGDRRPEAIRPTPAQALTAEERRRIVAVANEPRFAQTPPARIVPILADEGIYIASEASFHRVLRAHGQMTRRGRARPPRRSRPPTTHIAMAPGEVWCWDITFLPAQVKGQWFYLFLILDLYSRKIVGFEVHDTDSADHAAHLARRTALAEGVHAASAKPVLHGDNGATLKATTVLAMLNWLGIEPSYSRPRVSDDNPYVEALFRTAKYRPEFPERGFTDLDAARNWAAGFVHWYNHEHRHSAIRYVTPAERHAGADHAILCARHDLYQQARRQTPARWSRCTRNWTPVAAVTLNPEKETAIHAATTSRKLSGSAGAPALIRFAAQASRPDTIQAAALNVGQASSAASQAQRRLRREHRQNAEHRTLPGVSTVAPAASAGGSNHHGYDAGTGRRE
jgi:putative transposase